MACPGGCVGGGGQPVDFNQAEQQDVRSDLLYKLDRLSPLRFSHENVYINTLYEEYLGEPLSERAEEILHTNHESWKMPLSLKLQSPTAEFD